MVYKSLYIESEKETLTIETETSNDFVPTWPCRAAVAATATAIRSNRSIGNRDFLNGCVDCRLESRAGSFFSSSLPFSFFSCCFHSIGGFSSIYSLHYTWMAVLCVSIYKCKSCVCVCPCLPLGGIGDFQFGVYTISV